MLRTFFVVAMTAPARQQGFRVIVFFHVLFVAAISYAAANTMLNGETLSYLLLVAGMLEGSALIGWRLTQLPKSQALEFLLTSPIQPKRLFVVEALVGISRFLLVSLSALPILGALWLTGTVDSRDLLPLVLMPFLWGVTVALALTSWVYEPVAVRRIGELISLLGVLAYLVIGVVAAENLPLWLAELPEWLGKLIYDSVVFLHTMNPFGVLRYWFSSDRAVWLAFQRFEQLHLFAGLVSLLALGRGAYRLKGHFHDRHYRPITNDRIDEVAKIGDSPLSWWAVRRVMEYSGRVNLWLAGGFALVYASYIVAGDQWPSWMGRLVFQLFDQWGGAPVIATALAVMATVPAAFQFGLWDATTQDRCKRLELLLLTELTASDYWRASLAASWRRGRWYLFAAWMLWLALGISGQKEWSQVAAAIFGSVLLWWFSFAVGFRAFARGAQTSGLSSIMTLGLPLLLMLAIKLQWELIANFIPAGLCYMPLRNGIAWGWIGSFLMYFAVTLRLTQIGLARCDNELRTWYDQNQGSKQLT